MALLRAESLGRRVSAERWLFRNLDISLDAGEQLALQGASGVGKSTLLNLLAGLDQPDEGSLLLEGKDIAFLSAQEQLVLRRTVFGFVFQAFHLMPHLNVIQNVMVPCLIAGLPLEQAKHRSEALLAELGLANSYELFPAVLSGGEQQRVALARALVHQPKIVLADEPTGNLDPVTAELALNVLCRSCREHHVALIMVTHSDKAAAQLDRRFHLTS
ncbi:ABC transporter ATP-binding protein [Polynucleobacter antarcticus]|uniref:ABC transporter ATP-binding protein n=1 Tax=Polynucleobacter antarcticus TaxID=1743162 RepID=A0A6M9PSK7_9BURK|nr:ABC transporter ATP-binding protein [Polynucleobacter antarcticus]QKM62438.1 ABC transporter ATP-binding protein [Polynucleobacter antarcticus]